ncbi:Tll0287-like domain-containing protein [Rhodopseudomonas sp. NSM]|uniref:Tll0287-like domain-containing protein n=1 Tax=Rhodopseudomonas sp. NSM TaxID=3457630 RepID=UPI004036164F
MPTRIFLAIVVAAAVVVTALVLRERGEDKLALEAEAQALIKDFGGSLLGALKGSIESSGPVEAVAFCNKEAPGIAAQASRQSGGWQISRTSLKPRNPASAPDDFERKAMSDFVGRIAAGEPVASLHHAEIVEHDGRRSFRYVQAIPTGELCLGCHGSAIKPDVAAKIRALYPDDQATGFKPGEMRGAFTLSKPL